MAEWNEAKWLEKIRGAKNMVEVVEIMKEHPRSPYSSMLTDDPMSTFTVLQMMSEDSTPTTPIEKTKDG